MKAVKLVELNPPILEGSNKITTAYAFDVCKRKKEGSRHAVPKALRFGYAFPQGGRGNESNELETCEPN